MLKDKVIKPLLVATEKVVEYYFPEEELLPEQLEKQAADGDRRTASAYGGATTHPATLNDDQVSVTSSYESEMSKVRNDFSKLTLNGSSNNLVETEKSSQA